MGTLSVLHSLTFPEGAGLVISALGAIGTVAAAFAAWRAAAATNATVSEMREMRLQGLRPAFDIALPSELILEIGGSRSTTLFAEESDDEIAIRFKNISNSPAADLSIEWLSGPRRLVSDLDEEALVLAMSKGGFELLGTRADYRNLERPGTGGGCAIGFSGMGKHPVASFSACVPEESVFEKILENSFVVAAVDFISRQAAAERDGRKWKDYDEVLTIYDLVTLKYHSLAGEAREERLAISIWPHSVLRISPDGRRDYSSVLADWQSLQIRFSVGIIRVENDGSFRMGFSRLKPPTSVRGIPSSYDVAIRDKTFSRR